MSNSDDTEQTLPPGAGDEASNETSTSPQPIFVSFEWERAAPVCELDGDCRSNFQIVGAGTMVDSEPGAIRSVRARATDYYAFTQVAMDETVRAALRDGSGCTAPAAGAAEDRVVLRVGSEAPIAGHIGGCTGAPYDRLRSAIATIRAEYFPH